MAFVTTVSPDLYATTSNLNEIPAGADPLQYADDDKFNQILAGLTALHGWASGVPVSETASGHFLALAAGSSAAVSIAGGVRIRQSSGALDYSYNTGAYARLLSKLTLASQTTGDLMYASDASTWARLGAGTNGYVLTMSGGLPTWAAAGGGGGGIADTDNVVWTGTHSFEGASFNVNPLATFAAGLNLTGTLAVTGGATISTTLGLAAGAVGAPSLYQTGDTNTGIYFPAADQFAVTTAGTARLLIDGSTELHSLIQTGPAGSASLPTYGFTGDPNTGAYNIGADQYGITAGGTLRLTVSTTLLTSTLAMLGPDGSASVPTWGFASDATTGIYRSASGTIALTNGGTNYHTFSSTNTLHGALTATTNAVVSMFEKRLNSSGTAAVGFGMADRRYLENASGSDIECATEAVTFTNATAASETVDWTMSLRSAGSLVATAKLTGAGAWQVGAGSASLPSLSFTGDTNTGLYSSGADEISTSIGGTQRHKLGTSARWKFGSAALEDAYLVEVCTDAAGASNSMRSTSASGVAYYYAKADDVNAGAFFAHYGSSNADTFCGGSNTNSSWLKAIGGHLSIGTNTAAKNLYLGANNVEFIQCVASGAVKLGRALAENVATSLAAANNLAPDLVGSTAIVTGNTQINLIDTTGRQAGSVLRLVFTGTPTVKHGQATSGANQMIRLSGSVDLVAAAHTVLTLVNDGTQWQEIGRKVA